jgi:hypothetical protein
VDRLWYFASGVAGGTLLWDQIPRQPDWRIAIISAVFFFAGAELVRRKPHWWRTPPF